MRVGRVPAIPGEHAMSTAECSSKFRSTTITTTKEPK